MKRAAFSTLCLLWGGLPAAHAQTATPTPDCCRGVTALAGSFGSPEGEVFDYARDRFYVTDRFNNVVHVFTAEGSPVGSFGAWTGGQFNQPADVAVDSQGNIYVADYNNRAVEKFDFHWNYITSFADLGPDNYPRGVWVDDHGATQSVYVSINYAPSAPGWGSVYRFDGSGAVYTMAATLAAGTLNTNTGLVQSGSWLYVTDTFNGQIVKFDTALPNPSAVTVQTGLSQPTAIRTDPAGYFYVAEYAASAMDVYTPDFSTRVSQCQAPGLNFWGVAADATGRVFLSELAGNAVTVLQGCVVEPTLTPTAIPTATPVPPVVQPPGAGDCFVYPSPARGNQATVSYNMAEPGRVELKVWNEKAELVARVFDQKPAGMQVTSFSIAGFTTGVYFYTLTFAYGSGVVEKVSPRKFVILH